MFYPPNTIDRELKKVFSEIDEKQMLKEKNETLQMQNLSHIMAELNIIHPFREGNGRCIREFVRCMALQYGYHLNWGNVDRETLINAAVLSVDNDMAFCDVLAQCVETEE
jgi:cell filamentation protein